jgi:hypothetical protein
MPIQLKRNDTKDVIGYSITHADGTPVNLTGATVRFIMGKGKTLLTNAVATIVNAASGSVEYTLTEEDTLEAGVFNAEFEVTFSTGKVKTYPNNGYIKVTIQANIDKDLSTYIEDQIAYRVSDLQVLKNEIQAQLNQFAIGATNAETSQARVEADGTTNTTLKARLDKKEAEFKTFKTDTTTQLAQKAAQTDLSTQASRIDNLVANVGNASGNSEIVDMRVGSDGVTYSSSGQALRTQLTNLTTAINLNDISNLINTTNKYNVASGVTNSGSGNVTFAINTVNGMNQYNMNIASGASGLPATFTFSDRNVAFTKPIAIVMDFTRSVASSFFLRLRFKDSGGTQINAVPDEYFYYSAQDLSGKFVITSSAYPNAASVDIVQFGTGNSTLCNFAFTNFRVYNLSDYNISTNTLKMQVSDLQGRTTANESKKATIMFDFDQIALDNRQTLMKQYGFKANFNVNNSNGLDANIKTSIKSLVQDGHSINLYGGYGTKPTDYINDVNGWQTYVGGGLSELKKAGIYAPIMYACSGMQTGTALDTACRNLGFKYVRAASGLTSGGTVYYNGTLNTNDKFNIWAYTLPERTYADIKTRIDEAVANGTLCILFTHLVTDTGSANDVSLAIFTQVLDYVKSLRDAGKINVLNIHDFWNVYNTVQGLRDDLARIMSAITNLY